MYFSPTPQSWGWGDGFQVLSPGEGMTYYTNGYLVFDIKTTHTDPLLMGFKTGDWAGGRASDCFTNVSPSANTYGFVADGSWHTVVIPVADLMALPIGADGSSISGQAYPATMSDMRVMMCIKDLPAIQSNAVYLDNIRYQKAHP